MGITIYDEGARSNKTGAVYPHQAAKRSTYPLAEDEPLISGGIITSFFMVQLALFIEEEFGVHISDAELTVEHLDTLRQMTDLIMKAYRP